MKEFLLAVLCVPLALAGCKTSSSSAEVKETKELKSASSVNEVISCRGLVKGSQQETNGPFHSDVAVYSYGGRGLFAWTDLTGVDHSFEADCEQNIQTRVTVCKPSSDELVAKPKSAEDLWVFQLKPLKDAFEVELFETTKMTSIGRIERCESATETTASSEK